MNNPKTFHGLKIFKINNKKVIKLFVKKSVFLTLLSDEVYTPCFLFKKEKTYFDVKKFSETQVLNINGVAVMKYEFEKSIDLIELSID